MDFPLFSPFLPFSHSNKLNRPEILNYSCLTPGHFYYMSRGSLTETQSHLEYGKRVGYISEDLAEKVEKSLFELYNDINKVIITLKQSKK